MEIYATLDELYPEAIVPAKFDSRYVKAYALQSGVHPEIREWIENVIVIDEKILVLRALNDLMAHDSYDDYGNSSKLSDILDPFQKKLTKKILEEIQKEPLLMQLQKAHLISVDFKYDKIQYNLNSLEEYHAFIVSVIWVGKGHLIRNVEKSYRTKFSPKDLKKLFLDSSYTKELKSLIYTTLSPDFKKFLHAESFTSNEIFKNFKDVQLTGLKITNKVSINKFVKTAAMYTTQLTGADILTIESVDDLRDLASKKIDANVLYYLNKVIDKPLLTFYKECAIEHGFLDEFYRFLLTEGDKILKKEVWSRNVKDLGSDIGEYIFTHPEQASKWHPLIDAILHDKPYEDDTSSEHRLESIMNFYLQKYMHFNAKNLAITNKMLGIKQKHFLLHAWKNRSILSPDEIELHL